MTCERFKDLFTDALTGSLEDQPKAELEAHLMVCASCREEAASVQAIWEKLSSLPEQQPSSALDMRVKNTIEAFSEGMNQAGRASWRRKTFGERVRSLWPRRPGWQFAGAMVFFALGLFIGFGSVRGLHFYSGRAARQHPAFAELQAEISSLKQLVTLSLLQQPMASERLRGTEWTARLGQPDEQVISALLRVVDFDPNVNVRLAAVGALQQFAEDLQVRKGLVEALGRPQSPMVQIGLINVLVRARQKESITVLKVMLQDREIDEAVRKHVEWALQELS